MNSPLRSAPSRAIIPLADLKRFGAGWVLDGQYRQLSKTTTEGRRVFVDRFVWWLERSGIDICGPQEVRGYLAYLATGHMEGQGRWDNPKLVKPLRPRTVKDHYSALRTFFRFLKAEGYVEGSPLDGLRPPIHRADQIQPFTEDQVAALLRVAKKSRHPKRDEALLLFLLDTGVRASELCNLDIDHVDVVNRKAIVLGKGNKHRAVYFGRETGRVLWQYLKGRDVAPKQPLFLSERNQRFTRSGLLQLIERLGIQAKIEAARCSPHTFRHTFAVMFLRAGGSVFTLREMLGHTDLAMTNRYVALAQADVQNQHRQFSPVERLRGKK